MHVSRNSHLQNKLALDIIKLEGREIELVNQIVLERPPEKREIKKASDLIRLFNRCFKSSENTLLIGNASEPIYLPADEKSSFHRIFFTQDYFSSALHEVAHWCVAGSQRRKKVDYGYWYLPDGRSAQQQQAFEQVEVKPQALEAAFSIACNIQFRVSVDNLSGEETCCKPFEHAVKKQLSAYIEHGFNPRTTQFLQALHRFYSTPPLI